jgi:MFS family permease
MTRGKMGSGGAERARWMGSRCCITVLGGGGRGGRERGPSELKPLFVCLGLALLPQVQPFVIKGGDGLWLGQQACRPAPVPGAGVCMLAPAPSAIASPALWRNSARPCRAPARGGCSLIRWGRHAEEPRAAGSGSGSGGTAVGQTRGEGKKEGQGDGRRIGSGSIPNLDPPGKPQLRAMYISQILSGFADRVWEFSIPFFLLAFNRPDSMMLAIMYAGVAGLTNVAGGPIVGYAVTKYPRLKTVTVCLMLQSILVMVSFIAISWGLSLSAASGGAIALLVFILTLTSSAASLASLGATLAVERDWIKCLNRYEEEDMRQSERILRGIGIGCRISAPLCVGVLLSLCTAQVAAAGIAAWSVLTIWIEWAILRILYFNFPRLSVPRSSRSRFRKDGESSDTVVRSGSGTLLSPTQTLLREKGNFRWFLAYKASWLEYLDVDAKGDGVVSQSDLSFAVRSGVMRCWDLWFGCIVGMSFFVYIKRLLAVSYI